MGASNTVLEIPVPKNSSPDQLVKALADAVAERQARGQSVVRVRYSPSLAGALRKRLNLDADNPIFSFHGVPAQEDSGVEGFRLVVATPHGAVDEDAPQPQAPAPPPSSVAAGYACRNGCGRVCVNAQGRAKHEGSCPSAGAVVKVLAKPAAKPAPKPKAAAPAPPDLSGSFATPYEFRAVVVKLLKAAWRDERPEVTPAERDVAARAWSHLEALP